MKRMLAACLLLCALPGLASAAKIDFNLELNGGKMVVFDAVSDMPGTPGKEAPVDPVLMAIDMQIAVRFAPDQAQKELAREGSRVWQTGDVYQDGKVASMWRSWKGEQADSAASYDHAALNVNLETGMEIYLDEILTDYDAAIAEMEAIIQRDVLDGMSGYLEYDELLPMPTDCYSFNEQGLTIYWDKERYRYFNGEAGSITFLWHEIADYIGESSPAYAVSRPKKIDVSGLRTDMAQGTFDEYLRCSLHTELGEARMMQRLGEPDYTTDAMVYPIENMRGFAVEIPKYAETSEEETRISAVRASRIATRGLMTGKTTVEVLYSIFGEPKMTIAYDEDAAADALLEPGESLYFEDMGSVLQAHFDEDGVLACLILRDALPESLY